MQREADKLKLKVNELVGLNQYLLLENFVSFGPRVSYHVDIRCTKIPHDFTCVKSHM